MRHHGSITHIIVRALLAAAPPLISPLRIISLYFRFHFGTAFPRWDYRQPPIIDTIRMIFSSYFDCSLRRSFYANIAINDWLLLLMSLGHSTATPESATPSLVILFSVRRYLFSLNFSFISAITSGRSMPTFQQPTHLDTTTPFFIADFDTNFTLDDAR